VVQPQQALNIGSALVQRAERKTNQRNSGTVPPDEVEAVAGQEFRRDDGRGIESEELDFAQQRRAHESARGEFRRSGGAERTYVEHGHHATVFLHNEARRDIDLPRVHEDLGAHEALFARQLRRGQCRPHIVPYFGRDGIEFIGSPARRPSLHAKRRESRGDLAEHDSLHHGFAGTDGSRARAARRVTDRARFTQPCPPRWGTHREPALGIGQDASIDGVSSGVEQRDDGAPERRSRTLGDHRPANDLGVRRGREKHDDQGRQKAGTALNTVWGFHAECSECGSCANDVRELRSTGQARDPTPDR
jgi:hypothetical protein